MSSTVRELFRRRERVRRAVAVVEHDKRMISVAYDRFLRRKIARPATIATFAAAGAVFGLWHYRRRHPGGRHPGGRHTGKGKGIGLGTVATAFFWISRWFGRHAGRDRPEADSAASRPAG